MRNSKGFFVLFQFAPFFLLPLMSLNSVNLEETSAVKDQDTGATCALPTGLQSAAQCLDGSGNLIIGSGGKPNCSKVVLDSSMTGAQALKKISIEADGEAYIGDRSLDLEVEEIEVAGLFQVGTKECPIGTTSPSNQVTMTFTGERPCASPQQCSGFHKGLMVQEGGSLRLFGVKGVPASQNQGGTESGVSWTHLNLAAGPEDKYGADSGALVPVLPGGTKTLQLARDVTTGPGAWQIGDWISVGTTSFSSVETEIVQIADLKPNAESGGTQVTLVQDLKHYHFGSPDPGEPSSKNFNYCSGYNYGVDERAEVGLLSRNIKLTARIEAGENNKHWGGETMFMKGFKEIALQGVQIEKFGKDQLASYPVHFHMAGDVGQKPLVNANSIHHSYNKCVTVHSTSNLSIENEVCTRAVGHLFYQEIGDESGVRYLNNLGLGAMSHYFDVKASSTAERDRKIKDYWWSGDNLGQPSSPNYNGYDGFNIPNTDKQDNPVRGACATPDPAGGLIIGLNPYTVPKPGACAANELYFEPASGFWIINPGTELIGNSIGGCQDVGRGYWYVPPQNIASVPAALRTLDQKPLGTFRNNRVHSCYSGLYDEAEFGVLSSQLFPREGGSVTGKNVIATFDGLTSTRNRDRGIWMRPVWLALTNSRFATNRNSVTLVSSGGLDGNAPGVWALLEDSVLVGMSQNNVDRWGPCPRSGDKSFECVDNTKPASSEPNSAKGFPSPFFNLSGYMIYDGPVRIFRDRFVNFKRDITPHLTVADKKFLEDFRSYPNGDNPSIYEGDAALGWFQNNQSGYPTGTESRDLIFDNVDLRHQIYTEKVNLGDFQDGDRNTAILDIDGSLTGFHVVDGSGNPVAGAHPISLNNLEFNQASNSVDECLAAGQQDDEAEGRPTSLISAASYATLEFQALFPPPLPTDPTKQLMTFKKDQQDFNKHSEMHLTSRNGLGVWEPKVASGYGYTVGASPCQRQECSAKSGIPARVSVGLTDAVKPVINETDPFFVRVGICYTGENGQHPAAGNFSIKRGYRSWGGNGTNTADKDLQQYFNVLQNRYEQQTCHNLDFQNILNRNPDDGPAPRGCPAAGVTPIPTAGSCPAPSSPGVDQQNNPACIYPKSALVPAATVDELKNADGSPDLTKYFYDEARGLLFFYVAQDLPNAFGTSPLGSCTGANKDATCPDTAKGESYYACPPGGCVDYLVELDDPSYVPGPSKCEPYPEYAQNPPTEQLKLAYIGSSNIVDPVEEGGKGGLFPHYKPAVEPSCPLETVAELKAGASGSEGVKGLAFGLADELANSKESVCPPTDSASQQLSGGCSLQSKALVRPIILVGLVVPFLIILRIRKRRS